MSEHTTADWPVEVVRSRKRKKTVSAEIRDGTLVVRAPERMSDQDLAPIIAKLQKRLERRLNRPEPGDTELEQMARRLNRAYFDGRLQWQWIKFVANQKRRFGSCTPANGTIRISNRLARMPKWVLEYVVVHELAHLEEANHGPAFWELVYRYPLTERARGYLMAVGLEDVTGEVADDPAQ